MWNPFSNKKETSSKKRNKTRLILGKSDPKEKAPKMENKPDNGNADDENNKPIIEIGDFFYFKKSRKVYQIVQFEQAKVEGEDEPIIFVVYMGKDSVIRKLDLVQFLFNFQKINKSKHSLQSVKNEEDALKNESDGNNLAGEGNETIQLGIIYEPTERHTLENMILYPDVLEQLDIGIKSIANRNEMIKAWGIDKIQDNVNANILNLYGASGTGKTMGARCLALKIKKPLYQVDYAQIVDKYVGETGKKISQAFRIAKEKNAILFFDEADSMLSKRIDMSQNSDYANSVNTNRNVLMQELDKFDGIVVMSTNFFNNYDDAMLRRINRHIEFKLPNNEMRIKLFKLHIPNMERVKDVNFQKLAILSKGLSGGDIKNICINSMEAASLKEKIEDWMLTQELLEKQIQKILDSKKSHKEGGSNNRASKGTMGFNAPVLVELD